MGPWTVHFPLLCVITLLSSSGGSHAQTPGGATAVKVDARFASPRATVRTFLASINATEEDPDQLDVAVSCLDLSKTKDGEQLAGRYAFELEVILRSLNTPTWAIPDAPPGDVYVLGNNPKLKVELRRQKDGRWLFDADTVQSIRALRVEAYHQALEKNQHSKVKHESSTAPAAYRSPRALFNEYVDACKKGDYERAAQCLDLSGLPAPARKALGRELAVKLKEVLDRMSFIIFQDVPDDSQSEAIEAVVRKDGRIVVERQSGEARKGSWQFNKSTVESIDRLYDANESKPIVPELAAHRRASDEPTFRASSGLWLRRRAPESMRRRYPLLGTSLALYQIIGGIALALFGYPVFRFARRLAVGLNQFLFVRRGLQNDAFAAAPWARPFGLLMATGLWRHGVILLDLPTPLAAELLTFLVPAYVFLGTALLFQLVDPAIHWIAGPALSDPAKSTRAAMGYPVISLVLKMTVAGFGLATLLELFDVDVKTVLTGLGIGGLAFALAAQDTLKNFFGSIMLIADRTFRVGDQVKIGANEGQVESVGIRSTRIRGLDDSLMTVPNSDLTTQHVINHGARRYRRFKTPIPIAYGTSIETVNQFCDAILQSIRRRPDVRQDDVEIAIHALSGSAIEVQLQLFFDVPDGKAEAVARHEVILEILRLAEQWNVAPLAKAKALPAP
jgi:MscS family membrane protein